MQHDQDNGPGDTIAGARPPSDRLPTSRRTCHLADKGAKVCRPHNSVDRPLLRNGSPANLPTGVVIIAGWQGVRVRVTNGSGAAATLVTAILIITGCSGSTEEPAGLAKTAAPQATSPTPPEEPDPTPTSTVPPALEELRTLELPPGLVIEDIPDVTGAELAALDAFVRFEVAHWQSLLDSEVHDELDDLAADEVVRSVADQVDAQVEEGFHLGGRLVMDPPQVEAGGSDIAVVIACYNQGEVTVVQGGNEEIGEDAAANPIYRVTADLANSGASWIVTDYRGEFDSC